MTENTEIMTLPADMPKARTKGQPITEVTDALPLLDTARFEHMQRVANAMAATTLVPDALRYEGGNAKNPLLPPEKILSNCFMVVNQAVRWGMDPFAVAQCISLVHGKLCYEGKLVAAVLQAKALVNLRHHFTGQIGKDEYRIYLSDVDFTDEMVAALKPGISFTTARVFDGSVGEWKTTGTGTPWTPKNHRRMLVYRGSRDWCRIYEPALMLGVYTHDEMLSMEDGARYRAARDVTGPTTLSKQIAAREALPQSKEPDQEKQDGFDADFVKEMTDAIQKGNAIDEEPEDEKAVSDIETEAEPEDILDPPKTASEMIDQLRTLKTEDEILSVWNDKYEDIVSMMEAHDRSAMADIAGGFCQAANNELEPADLETLLDEMLGQIADRNNVQPA